MVRNQSGDYSCFLDAGDYVIASASPELFFSKNGRKITSRPMKGTSPRGRTSAEDFEAAEELRTSPKNRAENIMIVDMTRNDLSRVAERGSVSAASCCTVEKYPHMLQMTSEVTATSHASLTEIITALFPAASITGAPKTETMRIIAEKETTPRKIYTGTVGVITPHDRAWFNVAIRTALLDRANNTTEYGIGSGIIWDSQSTLEYEECINKATAVTRSAPPFELFETILWEPATGFFLLEEHLSRLADGADYLSWPLDTDRLMTLLDTAALECASLSQPQRVRIFAAQNGSLRHDRAHLSPLPTPYRISLAQEPISSNDTSLFRKTTDRRAYKQAAPRTPDSVDVILWNERGEITETTIANICLEIEGVLYTPPVASGLLAGCYRDQLVRAGLITIRTLMVDDLQRAQRIVLVNSVRRMWDAELSTPDMQLTYF
jgi:para-aminobenzoate synthetase/4-amino-4-deoxychorismate lyase